MKIINNSPATIQDCELFKILQFKSNTSTDLLGKVEKIIEITTPMLNLINSGPFRNYTLHNPEHAKKIIHLAGNIIDETCKPNLTILDISLIIMSAFIHDVGMSITVQERTEFLRGNTYKDFLQDSPVISERLEAIRKKHEFAIGEDKSFLEQELFQIQEFILSEILRKRHATKERYKEIINTIKITSGRTDLFEYNGATFEDLLIDICESHNLPAIVLGEMTSPFESRYSRNLAIGGEYINIQFCCAILRICDILDFDRERTPAILFESLGINDNDLPGSEISLFEWQKHMAVHSIEINGGEIIISGDCRHPAIEASVINFAQTIQREIQDTTAILKMNNTEILEKYKISIPSIVRTRTKSIGYVFQDLKLHLNPDSIMTLLMGEQLYSTPNVALRELIQNSIDACRVLSKVSRDKYIPKIKIRHWKDEFGKHWLEVYDNGIGMDYFVISEYLFKVGSSYYKSSDFKKLLSEDYTSISRFGIGLISVFMLADVLKIKTSNNFSIRGDKKERIITINNKKSLAFITENDNGHQGTIINIRLKDEYISEYFFRQFENYLETVIVRPEFPIDVEIIEKLTIRTQYMQLNPVAVQKAESDNIKYVVLDMKRYSNNVEGYVIFPFENDNGKLKLLSFNENSSFNHINPKEVFLNYRGNRLSVNGFRMGLKRTNRLFGKALKFAYDINILGDEEVKFDVARDRIIGRGTTVVKGRMKYAIIAGLKESGIFSLLTEETQNYLTSSDIFHEYDMTLPDQDKIFEIKNLIPSGQWPVGLHQIIAKQVNITPSLTYNVMSYLLDNNMIEDGRKV